MSDRKEAIMSAAAAILLLFVALLDPRVSLGLAVAMLIAFAAYKWRRN